MTDSEQQLHARNILKRGRLNQDGIENNMAKLNNEQVAEIIKRRIAGERLLEIAKDYKISFQHVSRLAKGQEWKHLSSDLNKKKIE